jgi:hypothetical protein
MKMIDTAVGLIDASRLQLTQETTDTPAGKLMTSTYRLDGQVVKIDQDLQVSEDVLGEVTGFAQL